jgi:predicted ATPase
LLVYAAEEPAVDCNDAVTGPLALRHSRLGNRRGHPKASCLFAGGGLRMPHEVFVSYASEDALVAKAACAKLEAAGTECWIAPRDPLPGRPYSEQIVQAILAARLVLLVFSRNANRSRAVLGEVEVAANHDKPILPLRLEDVPLSAGLEYYVQAVQWLDASTGPIEAHLTDLVTRLQQNLESLPEPTAAMRTTLDTRPKNFPAQFSSFVGREGELRSLREALAANRLVTITGMGGIGKSRLALRLGESIAPRFRDGTWLVELARIEDSRLIAQAVAGAIGIREDPQQRIDETLLQALAAKQALLVLDCAEHLLSEVAALATRLLQRCPDVRVLVTSREPLHVAGEHVEPLRPLSNAVPDASSPSKAHALSDSSKLFIDRARSVQPDFAIDDAAAGRIARICERLERIPLAIELAAARIPALSLAELDARLADRFKILVSRDVTRDERQRTLRQTIDWSFRLLTEAEREFARELTVFNGTFTLDACEAVTVAGTGALDLLESLVEKSLIVLQNTSGGSNYYHIYDTIREYALTEIGPPAAPDQLHLRHFRYFAALATRHIERELASDQASWLDTIDAAISNVRGALEWALEHDSEGGARFILDLCRYWQLRGHISEGSDWLARALADVKLVDTFRAPLLRRASTFATIRGDYDRARALGLDARTRYGLLRDTSGVAESTFNLGMIEQMTGQPESAAGYYAEALEGFRAAGNTRAEALAIMNLVLLALRTGDVVRASTLLGEATRLEPAIGDANVSADITHLRGLLAIREGDFAAARHHLEHALVTKEQLGTPFDVGEIRNNLSAAYLGADELRKAVSSAREGLRIALEIDSHILLVESFEAYCEIAIRQRRFHDAAKYFVCSRFLRDRHSYRQQVTRIVEDMERSLREALGASFAREAQHQLDEDGTGYREVANALLHGQDAMQTADRYD